MELSAQIVITGLVLGVAGCLALIYQLRQEVKNLKHSAQVFGNFMEQAGSNGPAINQAIATVRELQSSISRQVAVALITHLGLSGAGGEASPLTQIADRIIAMLGDTESPFFRALVTKIAADHTKLVVARLSEKSQDQLAEAVVEAVIEEIKEVGYEFFDDPETDALHRLLGEQIPEWVNDALNEPENELGQRLAAGMLGAVAQLGVEWAYEDHPQLVVDKVKPLVPGIVEELLARDETGVQFREAFKKAMEKHLLSRFDEEDEE